MKKLSVILLMLLFVLPTFAQIVVTENGVAKSRIIVTSKCDICSSAATLLQDFVQRSSGAKLEILIGKKAKSGDIVVGDEVPITVTEDGYRLQSRDGVLYIGGRDKGVLYGVISLLECELNADYLAKDVYCIDQESSISFAEVDTISNPAFRYRQTQVYGLDEDPIYKSWLRLEEPREIFAGGLWVHTFHRILSCDEFGESHPEYFSYIDGIRRPGHASQWCLSNEELFQIVVHRVDSIFKANPDKKIISISQNDSSFTYCRCEECQKVTDYEGEPSGGYIRYVNRLAELFPDKEFSTLAYNFTMKPPKHVKPLPNVNIMLCNIGCTREVPLTDNETGKVFVEAMEGWNEISDNIFVWDYGINFDNIISPFPNFSILQPNIELFKKNDVTMHFSQISGMHGCDFAEMRAYMVSKLMWNPHQDADSLMRHFMDRYYGPAAPYIYDYQKVLEGGLLAGNNILWINSTPVSHADGMLNVRSRKRLNEIFDRAEAAVADDPVLLDRVHLSRLSLIYADLEMARTDLTSDVQETKRSLDLFEKYIGEFGIEKLNNHGNDAMEYCHLYRKRYIPDPKPSIAIGAKVIWEIAPESKYETTLGAESLVDGLFGGATFSDCWLGWQGKDARFVIDLGEQKEFSMVEADFLHQLKGWSFRPDAVEYSISDDGVNFTDFGRVELAENRVSTISFAAATYKSPKPVKARYIRVSVDAVKNCPMWHSGVGAICWLFMDEVTVK